MTLSFRRCALGAATSTAMLLAAAVPALAATTAAPSAQRMAAHFNVHGIVLAVHGSQVKVLASVAKVGRKAAHHKVVTLTVTRKSRVTTSVRARRSVLHPAALRASDPSAPGFAASTAGAQVGEDIVATGTVASNGALLVTSEHNAVLPAEALVGKILAVNADGSFTVDTHDQVDGEHSEHDSNDGVLVFAVGATVTGAAPAAGQYVVVLGESEDHQMAAAKIYTFAAPPALAAGQVTAADPATKTITIDAQGSEQDGQDQGDGPDGANPVVTVDASHAEVVVNGAAPSAAAFPAVGDEVLTVGTAGVSPNSITATLVFDFNPADNGSVEDNQNNEDHGDNGDHHDGGDS